MKGKMNSPLGTHGGKKGSKLHKGMMRHAPADKPHHEKMGKSMGGKHKGGRSA